MSEVIGWLLVAAAAVLFLIAYLRYRGIREQLIRPGDSAPRGAAARRAQSAVYAGQVPADRDLAAATRALARQTVNNYPLRWKYAVFTYPAIVLACLSLFAFAPKYALGTLVAGIVVAAIVTVQARSAYRGAQRIVATKKR